MFPFFILFIEIDSSKFAAKHLDTKLTKTLIGILPINVRVIGRKRFLNHTHLFPKKIRIMVYLDMVIKDTIRSFFYRILCVEKISILIYHV